MAVLQFQNVRGEPQGEPIVMDRRRRRLSTIVKQHANNRRPYMVSVHRGVQPGDHVVATDDTIRKHATWKDTLVGADDVVLITYLPLGRGGGGGSSQGKQIGMAVGMILMAVAAPYALPALIPGLSAAAAGLIGSGISPSIIIERNSL